MFTILNSSNENTKQEFNNENLHWRFENMKNMASILFTTRMQQQQHHHHQKQRKAKKKMIYCLPPQHFPTFLSKINTTKETEVHFTRTCRT